MSVEESDADTAVFPAIDLASASSNARRPHNRMRPPEDILLGAAFV